MAKALPFDFWSTANRFMTQTTNTKNKFKHHICVSINFMSFFFIFTNQATSWFPENYTCRKEHTDRTLPFEFWRECIINNGALPFFSLMDIHHTAFWLTENAEPLTETAKGENAVLLPHVIHLTDSSLACHKTFMCICSFCIILLSNQTWAM